MSKQAPSETPGSIPPYVSYEQTCEENKLFGQFTPSGELTMFVVNEAAHEQFEIGNEYYVDISPAPPTPHRADRQ